MVDDSCYHIRAANKYSIITTGDLTLEIYGDSDRLSQVVINFVNNAIKYAPESKDITISIDKLKENIRVSVSDKGPGIPEEKIPHLFERYYQIDGKNAAYSGLGLGLFICTEIIKKHDGKIGADSNLGQGSTFYFTLPIK
jgi:two-component system CheB/CheR fusion protein